MRDSQRIHTETESLLILLPAYSSYTRRQEFGIQSVRDRQHTQKP